MTSSIDLLVGEEDGGEREGGGGGGWGWWERADGVRKKWGTRKKSGKEKIMDVDERGGKVVR